MDKMTMMKVSIISTNDIDEMHNSLLHLLMLWWIWNNLCAWHFLAHKILKHAVTWLRFDNYNLSPTLIYQHYVLYCSYWCRQIIDNEIISELHLWHVFLCGFSVLSEVIFEGILKVHNESIVFSKYLLSFKYFENGNIF